jgi:hypothetical protein
MLSLDLLGCVVARGQNSFLLRKLLNTRACPDDFASQKTPLALRLLRLPHIALFVHWSLTFDLAEDIVEWFGERQPFYLPTAVQHLIMRSGSTSLHYYLNGGTSNYARTYLAFGERMILADGLCLEWMEEAMRSEGKTINSEVTMVGIQYLIKGGHM